MTALDRRLHAFRADLADHRLRNAVDAPNYVNGRPARVVVPLADMRGAPRQDAGIDTQLLQGANVDLFDESEGWSWVQARDDGYVGYVASAGLSTVDETLTHVVGVPRTFIYSGPNLKLPDARPVSLGSVLTVVAHEERRGTRYALLASGEAVIASHLREVGAHAGDYVAVAESLLGTPYLWGGASAFGIDCSGLVQLALRMAGRPAPRDSDMQAAGLGEPISPEPGLKRGDLVFWKGHVAIMTDAATIVHANGHRMQVSLEPLADATRRIAYLYGSPTGYRRP